MALALLSIPAMSASPERLFLAASLTMTNRRNGLSPESIEAVEFLDSWVEAEGWHLRRLNKTLKVRSLCHTDLLGYRGDTFT
jgi:hypothetical protein